MNEPAALSVEIAKLTLERGDLLVLKSPVYLSRVQRTKIAESLDALPLNGAKVLLLDPGWDLSVVKAQEHAAQKRARGHIALQALAVTLAFAFILGVFGPSLDPSTKYSDYGYRAPTVTAGEAALLEAQARERCAANHGGNAGLVILADGAVVCTDKHGRRPRNQITTLVRVP